MNTKERIQLYLDSKGIKNSPFEKMLGISNGYWKKTENISATIVEKTLEVFPDLSAEWLLRGEGSMLRTPAGSGPKKPAYVIPGQNEETYISGSTAHIPIDPSLDRIIRLLEQKDAQIERLISLLTSH